MILATPVDEFWSYSSGPGMAQGSATDQAVDKMLQTLFDKVGQKVVTDMATRINEVLAAVEAVKAIAEGSNTATKEAQTTLGQLVEENKALKARIDNLEGVQPPVVLARASQQNGLRADQLPEAHKGLVETSKEVDPWKAAAASFMKGWPGFPAQGQ
jgi:hypothetical protein